MIIDTSKYCLYVASSEIQFLLVIDFLESDEGIKVYCLV